MLMWSFVPYQTVSASTHCDRGHVKNMADIVSSKSSASKRPISQIPKPTSHATRELDSTTHSGILTTSCACGVKKHAVAGPQEAGAGVCALAGFRGPRAGAQGTSAHHGKVHLGRGRAVCFKNASCFLLKRQHRSGGHERLRAMSFEVALLC